MSGKIRLGKLAPQYGFIMNPYPDFKVSKCPHCEAATGQRKVPLLIHIKPTHFVALNCTCRYCRRCDLLIAHKHQIEHLLHVLFSRMDPQAIGNEYLVLGTVEKGAWREGVERPVSPAETLQHVHDFKTYYLELRMTQAGWFPRDQEPPVVTPPQSHEWVKVPSN